MSASSYQLNKFTGVASGMNSSLNATLYAANKASQYNLKTVNIKLNDKQNQSTSVINSRSNSKTSIKDHEKPVTAADRVLALAKHNSA